MASAWRDLHSPAEYLALARDPHASDAVRRRSAACPYPFVWEALATDPTTSTEVLHILVGKTSSGWNDNRLLALMAAHQHADHTVLTRVLDRVGALLEAGQRPYQAAMNLAARAEIDAEQIRALARARGASPRLRHGLVRMLANRSTPT